MDRYSNILLTLSLLGGETVKLTVVYINNKIPRYKSLNYQTLFVLVFFNGRKGVFMKYKKLYVTLLVLSILLLIIASII